MQVEIEREKPLDMQPCSNGVVLTLNLKGDIQQDRFYADIQIIIRDVFILYYTLAYHF